MLDSETRRRIDTARDILVGKVPDPKSQVEQITIALVYKFMDDMDKQSIEMGGKASFFKGKFAKYGWSNIFDPRLGGIEMLALYGEAITNMSQNENLPQLFRDIFKNAFLPYRDPETLKLFLKTINEFTYDHSEKLGDAFEYLLSVLGSQGDAGQFRTPRHIIDFMVQVVAPKKNETVLDPACGTAGFLISAYKYIVQNNQDPKGFKKPLGSPTKPLGSGLNAQDKKRIYENFTGYDISPDMVRLSLVNLYLHGFVTPQIYEYDSLTSEERWNEYADVILANPPFMSPKGGIQPHKRFSVQSNRSEVLFVDYMAEHLTPNGRAAIIVPEGIIFQSAGAYKQLRKYLIDQNYLWAVVSLPAGAFNPYSGVKTSILFLDKALAKKTDQILFVKVEADGFDLGAQRRPIDRNDLPDALNTLHAWRDYVNQNQTLRVSSSSDSLTVEKTLRVSSMDGKPASFSPTIDSALLVSTSRLAENEDYNLSADRYREVIHAGKQTYPKISLGEVAEIGSGDSAPQDEAMFLDGVYPFFRTSDVGNYHITENLIESRDKLNEKGIKKLTLFPKGTILFPKSGASTFLNHRAVLGREGYVSSHLATIIPDENKILSKFLFRLLIGIDARTLTADQNYPSLRLSEISKIQIPLPPLETQRQIVDEIAAHQRIIDGARQVVEGWKPDVEIDPDWDIKNLSEICETIMTGPFGTSLHESDYVAQGIPVINPKNIVEGIISTKNIKMVSSATRNRLKEFTVHENDIVIGRRGEMGRCGIVTSKMNGWLCGTGCFVIRLKEECLASFAFLQITSPKIKAYLEQQAIGVTMKNLNQGILSSIPIPLPPLEVQREIVARIERERSIVEGNRELIRIYEEKVKKVIERVWEG